MRRLAFALLSAMLVGLVGMLSFAVGGRIGFIHGYLLANHDSGVLAANMVVTSFHARAKGDDESAGGILELLIDSALISEWSRDKIGSEPPIYAPSEYYLDMDAQLRRLARYRKAHPRALGDADADAVVADVVARYTSAVDPE